MIDNQYSLEQIDEFLKQMENGTSVTDISKKYDISINTLFRWKAMHGGTENLLARLKELEEENYKLKGMLADIRIQREAENTGDTDRIYRILAANIPGTAITILDKEERYLLAEGDFLSTMGYVKESMPGKKISDVISPENYYGYYQQVIRRAFSGETILVDRQTISSFHSLMKVVPLKDQHGEIFAIMFVLIDVTAIKQANLELAKINNELESKVSERTEQLNEANKQLESFSYSVSHDLRAPLRSISGFARILKEDFSVILNNVEFDHLADKVISNASRMEQLITDLLEFSRLERTAIIKTQVNMDLIVQEVLSELSSQETSRKFRFKVDPLASVEGDQSLIRQIWINLISNAIKYSKKREISEIAISCSVNAGWITYKISDNGAGFDMKYADKLFGVFQRLHKISDFEGTGVGLALVKSIVVRHGGRIWAEAQPGIGATFYFSLPEIIDKEQI